MPGVVLHAGGDLQFTGHNDDHAEIPHTPELALTNGTVAFSFVADDASGWGNTLFSKVAAENVYFEAFVSNGRLRVVLEDGDAEKWLYSPEGSIQAGQEYHVTITFGQDGFWLYLDGQISNVELEFTEDLSANDGALSIGAYDQNDENNPWRAGGEFEGTISDFTIYNSQFDRHEVAELAGVQPDPPLAAPEVIGGVLVGTLEDDADLNAQTAGVNAVFGDYGNDTLTASNVAGAGLPDNLKALHGGSPSETIDYAAYANILNGGHGSDTLTGGDLNDLLISRADGREPKIAQEWGPEDDPYNEIDPVSNTHFPGQPIEGDDTLTGGGGADLFFFQTLD